MRPGFVRRAALSPRSGASIPSISDIRSRTRPYWLVLSDPTYRRTCVAVHYEHARRRGDRMTRRLPPPWHADKFSGGYVVRDANGFAVAYVYGRSTEAEALEAKQMTMDEARRVASNIAKLPEMLKRGNSIN